MVSTEPCAVAPSPFTVMAASSSVTVVCAPVVAAVKVGSAGVGSGVAPAGAAAEGDAPVDAVLAEVLSAPPAQADRSANRQTRSAAEADTSATMRRARAGRPEGVLVMVGAFLSASKLPGGSLPSRRERSMTM